MKKAQSLKRKAISKDVRIALNTIKQSLIDGYKKRNRFKNRRRRHRRLLPNHSKNPEKEIINTGYY